MPRALRIGINALYLIPGGVGGTEIYLRSLLAALAEVDRESEYFIYLNAECSGEDFSFGCPRFHPVSCRVRASIRPYRIAWEQIALPGRLRRDRIDVLLNPGFTAPLCGCPMVTVFHDLQHKRHPEFFRWFDLPFWNLLLGLAVRRSRRLIAVSAATAADLEIYYPGSGAKTVVIPHGVDREFFRIAERRRMGVVRDDRYILIVSTLHPHKNLARVMEAFAVFRAAHPGVRLVVAGLRGFAAEELESIRGSLGLESAVRFTGWIPRDELYQLFEGAAAFLAPSEFEGFGMPLIEALAGGIPTACSRIPPFDEIAGTAAFRFDPGSVEAIRAAMEMIVFDEDFRRRASDEGRGRAALFDWGETARKTRELLELAGQVN